MSAPVIIQTIPAQVVNALSAYGPVNFNDYIQDPEHKSKIRFSAALSDERALPKGMILTGDGLLTGIPAKDTVGHYDVIVSAENNEGFITTQFSLTIKPSLINTELGYLDQIKAQIWRALENRLPVPDLAEFYQQSITAIDIYYLLERWGTIAMWDAFNLEPPGEKKVLTLADASPHYIVYDRGSCLVAAPKDLYSYERTLADGLQTARALAREVYERKWTIELTGFDKYTRAAWIEIQHLIEKHGKPLEVINFQPSVEDVKLYQNQALENRLRSGRE